MRLELIRYKWIQRHFRNRNIIKHGMGRDLHAEVSLRNWLIVVALDQVVMGSV